MSPSVPDLVLRELFPGASQGIAPGNPYRNRYRKFLVELCPSFSRSNSRDSSRNSSEFLQELFGKIHHFGITQDFFFARVSLEIVSGVTLEIPPEGKLLRKLGEFSQEFLEFLQNCLGTFLQDIFGQFLLGLHVIFFQVFSRKSCSNSQDNFSRTFADNFSQSFITNSHRKFSQNSSDSRKTSWKSFSRKSCSISWGRIPPEKSLQGLRENSGLKSIEKFLQNSSGNSYSSYSGILAGVTWQIHPRNSIEIPPKSPGNFLGISPGISGKNVPEVPRRISPAIPLKGKFLQAFR